METPAPRPQPSPKPALIISGANNAMPMWPALAEMYSLHFLIPQAAQLAADMGIPDTAIIANLMDPEMRERVETKATIMAARVVNAMAEIGSRLTTAYDGIPAADAFSAGGVGPEQLNGHLADWFPGYCRSHFVGQMLTTDALERLIDSRPVAGCIVHEDVTPAFRGVVLYCKSRGIPTIHMPHAACHMRPEAGPDIHRETRTDWILASGAYMRDWYTEQGFDPAKIIMVGLPALDRLYDGPRYSKDEARKILRIENAKVIMYGTTWGQTTSMRSKFEVEFEETLTAVIELARRQEAVLVINLHPNENQQNIEHYANRLKTAGLAGLVAPANYGDLCLAASDLVVKHGPSNYCIESAIQGVPACYVQTEGFDFDTPLPPRGPASELPKLAQQAMDTPSEDWDAFARVYNDADGTADATDRAVAAVVQICQAA